MGIFRSEDMGLYEIAIPKDNSWDIMNELGKLNCLHFNDMNTDVQVFNLTFASTIRRCDEAQRRIKYIEEECIKYGVELSPPKNTDQFLTNVERITRSRRKAPSTLLEEFEQDLIEKEKFIIEQTKKYKDMHEATNYFIEYKYVLAKAQEIIHQKGSEEEEKIARGSGPIFEERGANQDPLLQPLSGTEFSLSYIAGVVNKDETMRLKKLVFRATRGNALTIVSDLVKPIIDSEGKKLEKSVYVIIFKEGAVLREKLSKICDSFMGDRFDIPHRGINDKIEEIKKKIEETKTLMQFTRNEIKKYLETINRSGDEDGGASTILIQLWFIRKEKALYHTLNKLKLENSLFRGTVWIPLNMVPRVETVVASLKQNRNIVGPQMNRIYDHDETPPTYFKMNEFIFPFQEIVSTYGIPTYKEANPAVFTIVTFPFLFGVMYGDIGHGMILLIFSIYICWAKESIEKSKSALNAFLPVRYLLLLMGIFATYCGFIYNDFLSIPLDLFGSCYVDDRADPLHPVAHKIEGCVYPFGIDPKWYVATNELTYMNSFKMKMAVILGVLQMSLGVCLKAFNALHFNKPLDLYFVFIPQIIFLLSIFGWMDIMIIYKWSVDWSKTNMTPPSIITQLVNIPLKFGSVEGEPLWGDGSSQESLQIFIFIIAFICVPLMLFPKPLIEKSHHEKEQAHHIEENSHQMKELTGIAKKNYQKLEDEEDGHEEHKQEEGKSIPSSPATPLIRKKKHDEYNFAEEFIHQLIETIEFVLGAVSNTASYLRLWALSLAHAQLANVFFTKTLMGPLLSGNIFGIFIGYVIFANATFGVLLCMDVMECFLHTLRLHWVEFQNKFYQAKGYKFVPLSYEEVLRTST